MAQARHVEPVLSYRIKGKDYPLPLSEHLLSFRFEEEAHGRADSLEVRLENREGLFQARWFPRKGSRIYAVLVCYDWFLPAKTELLDCGDFEVDEIEVSVPPSEAVLRAKSTYITTPLRQEKKTRAWEHTNLKRIAAQIAAEHGLKLVCDLEDPPAWKRVDQTEQSDLEFLKALCERFHYYVRVVKDQLIVTEKVPRHGWGLRRELTPQELTSYLLRDKSHDVYRACLVRYYDPDTGQEYEYQAVDSEVPETAEVLKVNERVEGLKEAERRAWGELRRRNAWETSVEIVLPGDPRLRAGFNVRLKDLGLFSGLYLIERAVHAYSRAQGYVTRLTVRRVRDAGRS